MKPKQIYEKAKALFETYLTEQDFRHTPERYHVLSYCCEVGGLFSMDQIVALAAKDFISRNTVYNTVNLLQKAKIVHSLNKQYESSKKPMFEIAIGGNTHTQFVCTKCGRISEFKPQAIETVIMSRKYTNFVPEHFTLYVYGECKLCRRLIGKNNK